MSVLLLKSGYTVKYSLSPWKSLRLYFTVYPSSRHNTDTMLCIAVQSSAVQFMANPCHWTLDTLTTNCQFLHKVAELARTKQFPQIVNLARDFAAKFLFVHLGILMPGRLVAFHLETSSASGRRFLFSGCPSRIVASNCRCLSNL